MRRCKCCDPRIEACLAEIELLLTSPIRWYAQCQPLSPSNTTESPYEYATTPAKPSDGTFRDRFVVVF